MKTGKKVLVVEDDDTIRETMVKILEEEGYSVASATNGASALQYLRTEKSNPSLIILDMTMPIMDGNTFLAVAKKDSNLQKIPVAVFTAGRKEKPSLAEDFLAKPVDLDDLLNLVSRYCQ